MNNNNDLTASATESDSGRSFERDVLPLTGHLHRRALTYYDAHAAEPQPWPRESFRNKYAELRANGVQHHPAMIEVLYWAESSSGSTLPRRHGRISSRLSFRVTASRHRSIHCGRRTAAQCTFMHPTP